MKQKLRAFVSTIGKRIGIWLEQATSLEGAAGYRKHGAVTDWFQPNLETELRVMASRHAEDEADSVPIKDC